MRRSFLPLAIIFLNASMMLGADNVCVVPGRGSFKILVDAGGLFSAFAHDHVIEAQAISGCATVDPKDLSHSSIKLSFKTANLKVLDPKESEKDRAKVQQTMETEVLHTAEFPEVKFESASIQTTNTANRLSVKGSLTIRGKTQSVEIPLAFTPMPDGTYHAVGKYSFKQSAFGIKPYQLMGGTVKVKDEIHTEFDLFLKGQ